MKKIQLVVQYFNGQRGYYSIPEGQGWKVLTESRQIVVGRGVPRTFIPLDSVMCYTVEEYTDGVV
jgi:hypothetical protein